MVSQVKISEDGKLQYNRICQNIWMTLTKVVAEYHTLFLSLLRGHGHKHRRWRQHRRGMEKILHIASDDDDDDASAICCDHVGEASGNDEHVNTIITDTKIR